MLFINFEVGEEVQRLCELVNQKQFCKQLTITMLPCYHVLKSESRMNQRTFAFYVGHARLDVREDEERVSYKVIKYKYIVHST